MNKHIVWIIGILLLSTMTLACTEIWVSNTDTSSCNTESTPDDYQTYTISYIDTNNCNTTIDRPYDYGRVVRCNVPGWDLLMNGQPVSAAYQSMDEPLGGWLLAALWIVIVGVIITRTDSWELTTILSLIFGAAFFSSEWFGTAQKVFLLIFIVLQMGIVLYRIMAKEKNI